MRWGNDAVDCANKEILFIGDMLVDASRKVWRDAKRSMSAVLPPASKVPSLTK
ncbi:hypothetical protein AA23498_2685 [Acetobacter nitrogenifigens DSM 23921 = NBRC 105050]|uniref:Uncharacterized protein n=1 Tax=Acetobacter nitrogenifigens DSM 23921 = NBRC 105050 TaxID=1120919 RepID=A0A511XEM8_9PROT|nr:hypothetical protein AA23498_2685 [Acetobacter nitrogenifigens DSM 23921 = NBRC 105050]GEN61403.1 hypothetical protein ANI02nite_32870 [Acetobacter nitrogenifigens DSM 23921 = NBRC 105050]